MMAWPCRGFKGAAQGAAEAALTAQVVPVALVGRQLTQLAALSAEAAVQQAACDGL